MLVGNCKTGMQNLEKQMYYDGYHERIIERDVNRENGRGGVGGFYLSGQPVGGSANVLKRSRKRRRPTEYGVQLTFLLLRRRSRKVALTSTAVQKYAVVVHRPRKWKPRDGVPPHYLGPGRRGRGGGVVVRSAKAHTQR